MNPRLLLLTVGVTALGVFTLADVTHGESRETPTYYQLVLEEALFHNQPESVRDLIVDLEKVDDHWGAVFGMARDYNMAYHRGAVQEVEVSEDRITMKVGMTFTPDPYVPGGEGVYEIELTQSEAGELTGSFEGVFNGVEVSGPARAEVYAPEVAEDHRAVEPGEHPRLLFRKDDLPALREKLDTPFGEAAKQRLKDANGMVAYGLLYQLTGDAAYVDKGLEQAEHFLERGHRDRGAFRPMAPLGEGAQRMALFYDLCYDALPEDYKARYRAWAANLGYQIFFAPNSLAGTNWHVVSNHVADLYAAMTMTSLVLFDHSADAPEKPSEPFLEDVLPPADDFTPGEDVPVVELQPGRAPERWLHTEPLRTTTPDDPREVFYGLEDVRPEPGTKVKVGEFELTFVQQDPQTRVDDDDEYGGLYVRDMLEADAAARLEEPFTLVGYTVIEVKEPGTFRLSSPSSRANLMQVALNGRLLADGQVVELEEGLYPMVAKVQWRMRWGHIAPQLSPADDADVEQWQEKKRDLRRQHETRMARYENQRETWQRTGGDPAFYRLLRLTRFTSTLHNRHAVGRGGFQGEVSHYSLEAMLGHARLWPAWRNVMGHDITPGNEYPDVIPRKLISGPQDINGTTRVGRNYFPALFPTIRRQWQPDVLEAWHAELGVEDAEDYESLFSHDPVRTFLHYPLDMEPAPVGTNLPRQWEAPDFGFYTLRSGWDDDAFIAQVFLKSRIISGWNAPNAGTFRLRGLGQNWATGPTDRVRRRQQENVVWLPEADLAEGRRGHLTHIEMDEHTMVISVDLDEIYEQDGYLSYTRLGNIARRNPDEDAPGSSGITGMRSMAFDFSGHSGVPGLFVTVDRIEGGTDEKRLWLFQPPQIDGKGLSDVVSASGKGDFTVQPGEGEPTLRGHFAHPREPEVSTEPLDFEYVKTWGTGRGETHEVEVDALAVPGTDHFFFVGTIGEEEHPEIEVEGEGLDTVITIGDRTIRFDGEKLILGSVDD